MKAFITLRSFDLCKKTGILCNLGGLRGLDRANQVKKVKALMKQFLITVAGVLVAFFIFFVALPISLIIGLASSSKPSVPNDMVLSLDLREKLTDQSPDDPFAFLSGKSLSTMDIIQSLHAAKDDGKVKAVLIRLPEGGMHPAAAEEIRNAIKDFRSSGKMVYAHSQGLYPDALVVASYMVGASASEFWMQPRASFQVTGISTETMFFKRAFDKYGVKPQFEQRYEFKNAVNPYLNDDFTPAHREATLSWMNSFYDSMIRDVAIDHHTDAGAVRRALEGGPYNADKAKALGLITKVGQEHDIETLALNKAGDNAKLVDIRDYDRSLTPDTSGSAIAVINGEGAIMTGHGSSGFSRQSDMKSDDVAAAPSKRSSSVSLHLVDQIQPLNRFQTPLKTHKKLVNPSSSLWVNMPPRGAIGSQPEPMPSSPIRRPLPDRSVSMAARWRLVTPWAGSGLICARSA